MTPKEAYEIAVANYPDAEFLCGFDATDRACVFQTSRGYIMVDKEQPKRGKSGYARQFTSPGEFMKCFKTHGDYDNCRNHRMFNLTNFNFIDLGNRYDSGDPNEPMFGKINFS